MKVVSNCDFVFPAIARWPVHWINWGSGLIACQMFRCAVTILSLILVMAGVVAAADEKNWKWVAVISGTDRITEIHVSNLLLSRGIRSAIGGSVGYGVSVPPAKAKQAAKLLRTDALKSGYYIWFGINDVRRASEPKTIVRRISFSSALNKPEFARDTSLGKYLRSKEIAKLTAKYPYIISISVHERQYLTAPKIYGTGYDVAIELQKSLRKKDDGYSGSYQVYDGGRSVDFLGSNEWSVGDKKN